MIEVVQAFDRTPIARLESDDRAVLDPVIVKPAPVTPLLHRFRRPTP